MIVRDADRKTINPQSPKGSLKTIVFDSTMEVADKVGTLEWKNPTNGTKARGYLSGGDGGAEWYGAPTVTELNRRFRAGWPAGSKRLLELATREINPTSVRRRRERADQGDEVDMQAIWRGDLSRAWTRTRRRSGSGVRSLTIVVNLGGNANITASQMFWRGAAALKLTDALTQAGYNVAIVGAEACKRYDGNIDNVLAQFVEIKAEDQPLDLDRLAALTAMPGYFRTVMFAGICYAADLNGCEVDYGLGSDTPAELVNAIKLTHFPETAFVQGAINDQASAEAWISKVLDEIEAVAA